MRMTSRIGRGYPWIRIKIVVKYHDYCNTFPPEFNVSMTANREKTVFGSSTNYIISPFSKNRSTIRGGHCLSPPLIYPCAGYDLEHPAWGFLECFAYSFLKKCHLSGSQSRKDESWQVPGMYEDEVTEKITISFLSPESDCPQSGNN